MGTSRKQGQTKIGRACRKRGRWRKKRRGSKIVLGVSGQQVRKTRGATAPFSQITLLLFSRDLFSCRLYYDYFSERLEEPTIKANLNSTTGQYYLGHAHTLPDSFCTGTKTIPDRASVHPWGGGGMDVDSAYKRFRDARRKF